MEPSDSQDRTGEISKLESKVVLALSRLQKSRYPSRLGKHCGVASKQIVNYLVNHYCYLDGDIESQVMTALLSGIKSGIICALDNGKFRLVGLSSKKMATNCMSRTSHGPQCTCLKLINAMRKSSHKTCCSYQSSNSKGIIKSKNKKTQLCDKKKPPKRGKQPPKKPACKPKPESKPKCEQKPKKPKREQKKGKKPILKCVQNAEKGLGDRKGSIPIAVAPAVVCNKKMEKCKYCLEKHSPPDNPGRRLCSKCHPSGTRFGVPFDKFSPREEFFTTP